MPGYAYMSKKTLWSLFQTNTWINAAPSLLNTGEQTSVKFASKYDFLSRKCISSVNKLPFLFKRQYDNSHINDVRVIKSQLPTIWLLGLTVWVQGQERYRAEVETKYYTDLTFQSSWNKCSGSRKYIWNKNINTWKRDRLAAILQTTFWIVVFGLEFHWSLLPRVQ